MDNLMEKAKKFLDGNYDINEIELSDGVNTVRLARSVPSIMHYPPPDTCYYPPYQYHYQYPNPPYPCNY